MSFSILAGTIGLIARFSMPEDWNLLAIFVRFVQAVSRFWGYILDCNNDGEEKEESMEDVESLDRFWDMGVMGFLKALACLIASNFIPCLNSSIRPKAEDTRSLVVYRLIFNIFVLIHTNAL